MTREELKALGLTDEQIESVMKSHGRSINEVKDKADQVDALQSQIVDYKTQIGERDEQLNELSVKVKDNEELAQEVNRLKEENATTANEFQAKLDKQAFEFKLDKEISKLGVYDTKDIINNIDTESIKVDGDTLLNFDDQIKGLKESKGYLFKPDEGDTVPQVKGAKPSEGSRQTTFDKIDISKLSYKEQLKLKQDNPEQYEKLTGQ